jgi:hypothetical protein
MKRLSALFLIAFALTGASCPKAGDMKQNETRPADLRPEGDPNRAVQAELDVARRAGTLEAYDLFLARHPQHPLAEDARSERARIAAQSGKPRG